jgi:bifunctional oligoribonuclease and PAP phosphatase NrnA
MSSEIHTAIRQSFQNAQRIAVISHIRPDGDAIGSVIGLGTSLQAAGKNVQMVLSDGIPSAFRFMEGSKLVSRQITGTVDLAVSLDLSDLNRMGEVLKEQTPDINIDHHITNLNFARLNWVDPSAVATSAILAEYLETWGLPINLQVASALLVGIISDSLGFRTSNMSPKALRIAADLMEFGANLPELYNQALNQRSFEAAKYWGCGLDRLQREGDLIWTMLTLEDKTKVSYPGNDDADLINILSTVQEAKTVLMFVEQKGGRVKVSWRSKPGVDVSKIAVEFGGGGHPAAAGVELVGTLKDVQEKVISATIQLLKNNKPVSQGS